MRAIPSATSRSAATRSTSAWSASTPHVSDLERGRLTGNFADYCNLLKLGHSLNICHMIAGYPVEPIDLPPATRHLDALAAMTTLCDRTLYGYALGAVRIRDSLEITRIARGRRARRSCSPSRR